VRISRERPVFFEISDSGISAAQGMELLRATLDVLTEFDDVPLVTKVNMADPTLAKTELKGHQPTQCRVLLDLVHAAFLAGDESATNTALDRLDILTLKVFPGYYPHYCLEYAQCLVSSARGQPEFIAGLIRRAREVGEASENPWVAKAADRLDQQIAKIAQL
jgi:hypothetical protein